MRSYGLPFFCFLLILAAAIALSCGSPPGPKNTTGVLESVTITPATADAENYPGGLVQFTATGYYSVPPSPVSPLTSTWGVCYQGSPASGVSVSKSGLAQCVSGSVGTYTIWAFAFSNAPTCPLWVGPCGQGGCQVTGAAQLKCP